ncbi:hypothetical protein Micbo1qcDRAFT_204613 [Microdochium bolleyi]|uniref:Xylanolytic transcriptional activator regulatory domain-containing protein n=1 Tax=Microdochium bolleyi TaxID=196109 RepID=A0A136J2N7_9PEZI|nr:hypothetical protein Micbo1qcDRAFT_204613 [Microdochium bolleyi]
MPEAPDDIRNYIGDIVSNRSLASAYFAGTHTWLPMVSARRLTAALQTGPLQFDVALLLLAMKLATTRLADGTNAADHYFYAACKRYTNSLPAIPYLSLSLLQALVLVAVYEYGHGIFPAAWMTIGQCVQCMEILGLALSKGSDEAAIQPGEWSAAQERHRTWWAVFILERMMGISSQKRLLCAEPTSTDALPSDETSWEQRSPGRLVSLPPSEAQPAFARLGQAAIIAGQVIRHTQKATGQKVTGEHFDCAEVARLTTMAQCLCASVFADLAAAPSSYWILVPSRSLALSSVMSLLKTYSFVGTVPSVPNVLDPARSDEELALQVNSTDGLRSTAIHVAEHTKGLLALASREEDLVKVSPFVLDSMYQSASTLSWLETGGGGLGPLGSETNAQTLLEIGGRWHLGLEYLRCLEDQRPGITALAYTLSGRIDMVGGGMDMSHMGF